MVNDEPSELYGIAIMPFGIGGMIAFDVGISSAIFSAPSPPVKVQTNATNTASNVGSVTCQFTNAQAQYDTAIVYVKCSIAGDITSVTDTSGNTYTLICTVTN